ncbi:MAG: acetyl-CoA hydrolase/transferase C-terminal domain-containing protein [Deltaproteobacteria bacterium]
MYDAHYRKKLTTPENAVERISSGATIVHGSTTAEPPALLAAIADRVRSHDLKDIRVFSLLPLKTACDTILSPDIADWVHAYAWFVSSGDRSLVQRGLDYFVPNNFHEIPRLCRDFMEIDVTVTTVSPMDKAGFFSFGTVNDYTSTAARHCKTLIVEVNKHMPRVFGDSLLHISEVDAIIENDVPLVEISPGQSRPEDEIIGRRIAEMVPDGATIQLGIGSIPDAAARYLDGHKDLGIHTELFCPAMMALITSGVITGRKKTIHPRKHVFTNALGTRQMYEFLHDNPSIESYPVSYTNDPSVIRQNDNMISINSTIEVDLLGQCNSEYLAGSEFSGTGGQLDYVRGAFHSRGGASIIAFRSTVKDGSISRIIPNLEQRATVTVPRMDTHYLITEHGVTLLKGKSTRERALGIIGIAHPSFRDDLLKEAEKMHLV